MAELAKERGGGSKCAPGRELLGAMQQSRAKGVLNYLDRLRCLLGLAGGHTRCPCVRSDRSAERHLHLLRAQAESTVDRAESAGASGSGGGDQQLAPGGAYNLPRPNIDTSPRPSDCKPPATLEVTVTETSSPL